MKRDYAHLKDCGYFLLTHIKNIKNSLNKFKIFDIPIFIIRDANGKLNGFYDLCPHRGVPFSKGCLKKNYIQCSYHGWKFDLNGNCIGIPSQKNTPKYSLRNFSVIENSGFVFVNLSNTKSPFVDDIFLDKYHFCYSKKNIKADYLDTIENFLDPTHTPFIHKYLIRNPKIKSKVNALISRNKDTVKITYTDEPKQSGLISKIFEKERGYSSAIFHFPCTSEINYYSKNCLTLKIKIYLTPIESDKIDAHVFFYFENSFSKYISYLKYYLIFPFFYAAIIQDKRILEQQYGNLNNFKNFKEIICESDLIKLHLIDMIINKNITKNCEYVKEIYV